MHGPVLEDLHAHHSHDPGKQHAKVDMALSTARELDGGMDCTNPAIQLKYSG